MHVAIAGGHGQIALLLERELAAAGHTSTGIIRNSGAHEYVRAGVAPVSESALRNRHVRFFVEHNPNHATGDELACLAVVRIRDLARAMVRFTAHRTLRALGVPLSQPRS